MGDRVCVSVDVPIRGVDFQHHNHCMHIQMIYITIMTNSFLKYIAIHHFEVMKHLE